ncbi:MAG: ABC transporter permease subunit [Alphaproteobacteria bacterium]
MSFVKAITGSPALLLPLGVAILLVISPDSAEWAVRYPKSWAWDIASPLGDALKYIARDLDLGVFMFSDMTRAVGDAIDAPLKFLRGILSDGFKFYPDQGDSWSISPIPWVGITIVCTVFAFWNSGWRVAAMTGLSLVCFALFGLWESAMATLASVLVAVAITIVLGLCLGVVGYRSRNMEKILNPLYDIAQTTPVFSYLVMIILLFGFGPVSALIATAVFATPPMARVTTLALQSLPASIGEFGSITGCTPWQKMTLVLLPSARTALLVGMNQVIMMSLAMVIIASIIGAGGLGSDVLRALKSLRMGEAIEAGFAITIMAVLMDRLSRDFANRRPVHNTVRPAWWSRHRLALMATGAIAGALLLARIFPEIQSLSETWQISTGSFWNDQIDALNKGYRQPIGEVRDIFITNVMVPTKRLFQGIPWLSFVLFSFVLGTWFDGWRVGLTCALLLLVLAVTGMWERAMISLYLVLLSVTVALPIGLPIGIWAALSDRADRVISVVIDTIQTLPTFVYLIPVIMLFSIGDFPALVAIVLYALPPAIRYTKEGIRGVPVSFLEAAKMSGCSRMQTLSHVQIPIAFPQILLGINQTVMLSFGMLVITALVGTRGLEETTLDAIAKVKPGTGLIAGLGIAMLSIVIDRLIRALSNRAGKHAHLQQMA